MMKRFGISKRAFSLILCMVLGWAIALTVPQIHPAQAAVPFYWESINVDLDVQTNGSSGFSMLVLLDLTSFQSFQPGHTAPKCLY